MVEDLTPRTRSGGSARPSCRLRHTPPHAATVFWAQTGPVLYRQTVVLGARFGVQVRRMHVIWGRKLFWGNRLFTSTQVPNSPVVAVM